jgi:predicted ABC-type ATPase
MADKNLYIIAGCNGAGKTTASFTILPEIINCHEFVNADEIAKGLSPFQPEKVSVEAGRIMLSRINDYTVTLLFFWLQTIELAKERIKIRVSEGGHNIEPDVIERRYIKGINNLFEIYLPIVDGALVYDNSKGEPELLAQKNIDEPLSIINETRFNELKHYYDNR